MGARGALEGHFLATAGAHTAHPTLFWPRLLSQDLKMGGWKLNPLPPPQNLVEEEGSPSKPQSAGSNPTASHA